MAVVVLQGGLLVCLVFFFFLFCFLYFVCFIRSLSSSQVEISTGFPEEAQIAMVTS